MTGERRNAMKTKRKIIKIDEERCSGCSRCVTTCAEGALQIVKGKAKLMSEAFCDGLGACIGECPEGALTITERVSDQFDPTAVEEHMKPASPEKAHAEEMPKACGCPSRNIEVFPPSLPAQGRGSAGDKHEVPLVRKALSSSGKRIPIEEIVISRRDALLQKRAVA
jgi:ferredoxin